MPRRVPDIAKVSELVGFRPEMKLDGILERVVDYQIGRRRANGPGRVASSGSTRAPDQASTAQALVNRAILAMAFTLGPYIRQAEWMAAIPPVRLR